MMFQRIVIVNDCLNGLILRRMIFQCIANVKNDVIQSVYITRDIIKTFRAATSEYFDIAFTF